MERFKLLNSFEKVSESFEKINELTISHPLSDYINSRVAENSIFRDVCDVDFNPRLNEDGDALYAVDGEDPVVWTIPSLGFVSKDSIELKKDTTMPIFQIQAAKDWLLKYMHAKREDFIMKAGNQVAKALEEYEEEAGWRVIIPYVTSAFNGHGLFTPKPANIFQLPNEDPAAGYFSKELISRMIVGAERVGKRIKTLWISPEDMADTREYSDADVDPITLREILQAAGLGSIWHIQFRVVNSLGCRGKFNIDGHTSNYGPMRADEKGTFNAYPIMHPNIVEENGNLQLAGETQIYAFTEDIKDAFKMPIPEDYVARWDTDLTRRQRCGFFGWKRMGVGMIGQNHVFMGIIDRQLPSRRKRVKI